MPDFGRLSFVDPKLLLRRVDSPTPVLPPYCRSLDTENKRKRDGAEVQTALFNERASFDR